MPKYDPFQALRTIAVAPKGQSLINEEITVEPRSGNKVEITNSEGLQMSTYSSIPIRVIVTEPRKMEKNSISYTLTNGRIKTNKEKTLEIQIPDRVKLMAGKNYAVQFPKEVLRSVEIKKLLKHMICATIKK